MSRRAFLFLGGSYYRLPLNVRRRERAQGEAASAANEGAYFVYVTEICQRSQRSKRKHTVFTRLRSFIGCLI